MGMRYWQTLSALLATEGHQVPADPERVGYAHRPDGSVVITLFNASWPEPVVVTVAREIYERAKRQVKNPVPPVKQPG